MFWHNFKYSLITLIRNKMLIFWTFAFPIILGILFNLAFSDIEKNESLNIINIAIVDNEEFKNNKILEETFNSLSDKNNKNQLFNIKYVSKKKADKLLNDDKIIGYLLVKNSEFNVTVKSNGINETIFKTVVDEINQNNIIINDLTENIINNQINNGNFYINNDEIYNKVISTIEENDVNIEDISNSNMSYTMIEFYTLIAMACLYGGLLGSISINKNIANMSNNGKRMSITPIPKLKMILSSVLASYLIQVIGVLILLVFTIFILNVDYGNNIPLIILLIFVGSLAGLSIGVLVSTLIKSNDNTKTGIIISITMLGCFLSGMMGITMKYIIDTNIPILNKINPANMITDGFYSLYYYKTLNRYTFNIISLLIFSFILIFVSFISLRRQKYDSI